MSALVLILMGSDSDLPAMEPAIKTLRKFGIPYEITVSSAHRTPARTREIVANAEANGVKVIIGAAGGAAHLAGVIAAETTLPVIGVPLNATSLNGLDSLLSVVQMPPGIPVATMAIGEWGAQNAAIFAVQILALGEERLRRALSAYKREMVSAVEKKAERLGQRLES